MSSDPGPRLRELIEQMLNAPVPPTIANDEQFRFIYTQAYRHALGDVLRALDALLRAEEKSHG